jgi:hypothetical protein
MYLSHPNDKISIAQSHSDILCDQLVDKSQGLDETRSQLNTGTNGKVVELTATVDKIKLSTCIEEALGFIARERGSSQSSKRARDAATGDGRQDHQRAVSPRYRGRSVGRQFDGTRSELEASSRKVKELTAAFDILKARMDGTSSALARKPMVALGQVDAAEALPQHAQVN